MLAGILAASGCGGDDTTTAATLDADTKDGTTDAPPGNDSSMMTGDAGDSSTVEAPDANDAAMDAQADVMDGGLTLTDVTLTGLPHAVDEAYCTRLQQCCLVQPDQWNLEGTGGCVPLFDGFGSVFGFPPNYLASLDSGLVTYDRMAATTCLQELAALNCGINTASAFVKIQNDCLAAANGTVANDGGACADSLQCQSGGYCQVTGDAGACQPLQTLGQACTDTTRSEDCTSLGRVGGSLYCVVADAGTPVCTPTLGLGSGCSIGSQCQSGSCKYPSCVGSVGFSDPGAAEGTCSVWVVVDAGAGDAGEVVGAAEAGIDASDGN
jgi:hypothetical protein